MTLAWSRFNRIVHSEEHGCLLFNALSSTLARVDPDLLGELEKIRRAPDSYDFTTRPGLFVQLRLAKVLVLEGEEDDLLRVIRLRDRSEREDPSHLALTIAPTLGCNFDCSYCYERSRRPVHMDTRTEEAIVSFVRSFPGVRRLSLCWYGGEPLLRFRTIVSLTERLQALGLPSTAVLVTNGYLLQDPVIGELDRLDIDTIQVTLDGGRETHDGRRRHVSHGGTYDTILDNLRELMGRWGGKLVVRVNIDRENTEEFSDVRSELSRCLPEGDVAVYPGIVDHGVIRHPDSTCRFTKGEEADFFFEMYRRGEVEGGLFYPVRESGCMALAGNSFLIGPEGELYKCTQDLGEPDRVVGSVFGGGGWNLPLLGRYMEGVSPFDDPLCRECFFLPVCDGGCPHFRMQRVFEGEDLVTCPIYRDKLTEALEIAVESADDGS